MVRVKCFAFLSISTVVIFAAISSSRDDDFVIRIIIFWLDAYFMSNHETRKLLFFRFHVSMENFNLTKFNT